jgi:MFS family permease
MSQDTTASTFSFAAYGRILRDNRNFRLLWLAQVVSEIGDWLYAVSIYSLLLQLTGSARSVGLAIVLQLLPQVFMAPIAGVINDRLRRRSVMIFADIARVFIVGSMLFVTSRDTVWLVWILLFLETLMWALFEPGRSALVPNVCRGDHETLVANALSSTTWAVNLMIGAGLGGLVAVAFGYKAVFILNALSFVASALLLRSVHAEETHADHLPAFRPKDLVDYSPVWEGVRYVARDPRLWATMLVKTGMGLLGAHWVILPIFGERIFPLTVSGLEPGRGGALSMSLLFGSRGLGALLGSFLSGVLAKGEGRRMRRGICAGFVIVGLSYMSLSVSASLWTACLSVMAGHAGTSSAWVFSTTMLQKMTDDRFRGRVFSADFAGLFLMMSVVSFIAGQLVDAGIAVRTIALCTGIAAFVPAASWSAAQRYWTRPPHA